MKIYLFNENLESCLLINYKFLELLYYYYYQTDII